MRTIHYVNGVRLEIEDITLSPQMAQSIPNALHRADRPDGPVTGDRVVALTILHGTHPVTVIFDKHEILELAESLVSASERL